MAFDPNSTSFQEQNQQTNPVIATKSLACKLAKAAWHPFMSGTFLVFDPLTKRITSTNQNKRKVLWKKN